jgi:hypothetical protein
MPTEELAAYVRSKPLGKYARRAWYLYERITGWRLAIDDLTQGSYIDLLDEELYYTAPPQRITRQRVRDNLLGDKRFCPIVRRTEILKQFEQSKLADKGRELIREYPFEMQTRAMAYLYNKETKSSFEIEHILPGADRTERFVALLRLAEKENFFNKPALIDLQNRIVEERFKNQDYRKNQNYVGQSTSLNNQIIHYVPPKPEDLENLMEGIYASDRRMSGSGELHAVIHAAVVSYGFVFLHPFEDGNGRIHRFLIHNVLERRGFAQPGVIFPVSAVMLKNMHDYDASLEAFSRPVMQFAKYELNKQGRMTVLNDTGDYYRFMDLTPQAEALFEFIRRTVDEELPAEFEFLINFDRAKREIMEIVDMPDRLMDLFIKLVIQNQGTLSKRKREEFFAMLTDDEVARMDSVLRGVYLKEKI